MAAPSPEGELRTDSHIRPIRPIGPTPPNSKLKPQNSTLPKTCSSASKTDSQVSPATSQGAGELRTDSHIRPIRPIGPTPPNSKPKHPLSEYERALLEGKPFLEALHIHITSKTKPTPPPPGTSPWDSICEPVRPSPYAHFSPPPASSFKLTFG